MPLTGWQITGEGEWSLKLSLGKGFSRGTASPVGLTTPDSSFKGVQTHLQSGGHWGLVPGTDILAFCSVFTSSFFLKLWFCVGGHVASHKYPHPGLCCLGQPQVFISTNEQWASTE